MTPLAKDDEAPKDPVTEKFAPDAKPLKPGKPAPSDAPAKPAGALPKVGDTVYYHGPSESEKKAPQAATITHVFDADCVNLHVLSDGSFPGAGGYLTSVVRGTGPGCWEPR